MIGAEDGSDMKWVGGCGSFSAGAFNADVALPCKCEGFKQSQASMATMSWNASRTVEKLAMWPAQPGTQNVRLPVITSSRSQCSHSIHKVSERSTYKPGNVSRRHTFSEKEESWRARPKSDRGLYKCFIDSGSLYSKRHTL